MFNNRNMFFNNIHMLSDFISRIYNVDIEQHICNPRDYRYYMIAMYI